MAFRSLVPFRQAYGELKAAWPVSRAEVEQALHDPGLYTEYVTHGSEWLGMMDDLLAEGNSIFPLPEPFEKFTTGVLQKKTRKKMKTPRHVFFRQSDRLQQAAEALRTEMDRHLLFLKGEIFRTLWRELPIRKERLNIQSFEDLLIRLRRSLEKPGGDELALSVRKRYQAALIDEFQDTDPVQYAIFRNIFKKEESVLFLIGDPKQAIYSFRGADLFAYLQAAGRVDRRYTLDRNRRSEAGLIAAVNTVFGHQENPFLYREISFEPAQAEPGIPREMLTIRGHPEPPLHFWLVDSGEGGGVINKGEAEILIPGALADEIARLLRLGKCGEALIGNRRLAEGDLAVLVRTNRQARLMQAALTRLKIPSVLDTTENLFNSPEALEVNRVLAAIVHPHREGLVRAALATNLLGVNGETLERLTREEEEWEDWLSGFRDYSEMAERKGFVRMFRHFLHQEQVRSRLLALPNGERRLTNVLHLAEVLHYAALDEKLNLFGLLKWLARQRDPGSRRLEEHQLRLESDDEAVKIVTIHKSKGLEYPIVFCPFNWDPSKIKNGAFCFHDRADDWRLNLVVDPAGGPYRALAEQEELAENLRLLYVSLTRAKNRGYLIWGKFRGAETSALAYLLYPSGNSSEDIVQAVGSHFQALTDENLRQALQRMAQKSQGAIGVTDMSKDRGPELRPFEQDREELTGRIFRGKIGRDWRVTSFTGLTLAARGILEETRAASLDQPDHDQVVAVDEAVEFPGAFFHFYLPPGRPSGQSAPRDL